MTDHGRLLQEAQALAQAGDNAGAFARIAPVAKVRRNDLNLQMQAAMIARNAGEPAKALVFLANARKLAPNDPQIANIEANTLAAAGRNTEALRAFERLVARNPTFVDAHINRALTAEGMGDLDRALVLIDASLVTHPGNARLLAVRGTLLKNLGHLEEALATLDLAVAGEPGRARTHFSRGVTLRALERNAEAEAALTQAAQLGLTDVACASALAAVKLELDKVDEAEALYFHAFAHGDAEAGVALARLRREYRAIDDAFDHYAKRAEAVPGLPQAWIEWLGGLAQYSEYERLLDVAGRARRLHPDDRTMATLEAVGKVWAGDRSEAIDALTGLSAADPDNASLHGAVAEAALVSGDPKLAEHHALAATRIAPREQGGWSYLSTAWRMLGDEREFWLCDYDNFVIPTEVVPEGSTCDAASYAAQVAEVLDALHRTRRAPGNQSLRSGTQTSGALFNRPIPEIRAFRDAVMAAVTRAVTMLPDDAQHPFLSRKCPALAFAGSWSARLESGGGHHVAHYHSEGWLSSAYYARLPQLPEEGGGSDGYIQFGAPPAKWNLGLEPRRIVRPVAGRLVLFPSYMWHGTLPFSTPGTRLTSAFDIVPA